MNIADYILFAIIIIFMIIGGLKGLVMAIYDLVANILSLFLAFKFADPVRELLTGTSFYYSIYEKVERLVESLMPNLASIEQTLTDTMKSLPFPEDIKEWFSGGLDLSKITTRNEALGSLTVTITDFIMTIIIGLILFILFLIVFKLIRGLVKKISELPIIKQIDSIAGAIIGGATGVLIAYIICVVIAGLQTMEVMNVIHDIIQNSTLASALYNNNLLINLFR